MDVKVHNHKQNYILNIKKSTGGHPIQTQETYKNIGAVDNKWHEHFEFHT